VNSTELKHSKEYSRWIKTTKKERSVPVQQPLSTNKFARPPSNFVNKSPVPSFIPSRRNDMEVNKTKLSSSEADNDSSNFEKMKLSELKELAKARGIRGYSKLKKMELIQLLYS
ncbi:SAP-like protein BP-73, partial [Bienertia sinuspersici]